MHKKNYLNPVNSNNPVNPVNLFTCEKSRIYFIQIGWSMMTTEAVLFDLDGTLVDSLPLIFRTYRQVFDEMGIPWDEKGVAKMIGLPLKDIGKRFTGEDVSRFEDL